MNWEPSCFQSACVQDLSCAVTWQKDYKGSFKRACVHPGWTSCLTPFLTQLHLTLHGNRSEAAFSGTKSFSTLKVECLLTLSALLSVWQRTGPSPSSCLASVMNELLLAEGRAPWLDDFCSCSVIECPVLSFCNYRRKLLCAANTGMLFQAPGGKAPFTWGFFCFNVCV